MVQASARARAATSAALPPLLLAPLVLLAACASSQGPRAPRAPAAALGAGPARAEAARLEADVAWLADDAQQGRRAGTPDEERVAHWLAARFAELGLEPAGEQGYLQAFEVPLPPEAGPRSWLRFGEGAGRFFGEGEVAPLFLSEGDQARGRLLFAGYGVVDPQLGRDDYAAARGSGAVEGSVVLLVRGLPAALRAAPAEGEPGGAHGGPSGSLVHQVLTAKRMGASAVLVAPPPGEGEDALPAFDPGRTARAALPVLAVSADVARALVPGYDRHVARLDAGERALPEGPAVEVALRADVRRERGVAHNVLALLPGAAGGRAIVVGAHFDHLGLGGEGSLAPAARGEIHNGADDNASGTAAVLEIGRLLARGPQPEADVLFALWSGEELGLLGSEHWARHPTVPLERVAAKLNLDMVGRAGDGRLTVLGAGSAEPFAAWLEQLGPAAGLELRVSLSGQGVGGSDHQTFLRRSIPALHFFSGLHGDYHRPSDDVERFEAEGTAKVAELGAALLRRMAADPEAIAWVEPPPAEEGAGARLGSGWSVWFGSVPEYGHDGRGVLLAGTSPGSPAEKAGLIAGDVLVQVGDVRIDTIHDFVHALQIHKPGDVVLARYLRDGEPQEVRVTLATRE